MASNADIAILIKARDEASKTLDGVGKSAQGMGKELDGASKEAEKSSSMLSKIGPAAVGIGAGVAVVGGAAIAIKGFVGAASDMNETVSKSNTIFGANAAEINAWASGAAQDFGQSKQGALDAAATFGNMFTQLGIGTDVAGQMSMQMVELASDFASFHNANPAEVIEAQTAAFRGEYDALQKFVPTINAASVEQKALAMTGKALTSELTAQEKALATQALMMEGAGAAAGDFDRTSTGLANSTRTLSAMWADAQVTLGNVLLPAMTAVALFIVGTLIPGIEALITRAGPVFTALAEIVRTEFAKFQEYYETSVKPALDNVIAGVEGVVAFIREHWPQIEQIVRPVLEQIQLQVQTAIDVIMGILDILIKLLAGDFSGAWQAAQDLVATVWAAIQGTIQNSVDLILGILGVLRDVGIALIRGMLEGAQSMMAELGSWIFNEILALPGRIGDMGMLMWSVGRSIAEGIWTGAQGMLADVWGRFSSWVASLPGKALAAIRGGSPALEFVPIGESMLQGIELGIQREKPSLMAEWDALTVDMKAVAEELNKNWSAALQEQFEGMRQHRDDMVAEFKALGYEFDKETAKWVSTVEAATARIAASVAKARAAIAAHAPIAAAAHAPASPTNPVVGPGNLTQAQIDYINWMNATNAGTNIPNMAHGGIVRARPGGTVVRVAEAGQDEAIVPLGSGRMYGNHYGTVQIIAPNIRTSDDLMPGIDWGAA